MIWEELVSESDDTDEPMVASTSLHRSYRFYLSFQEGKTIQLKMEKAEVTLGMVSLRCQLKTQGNVCCGFDVPHLIAAINKL